MTDQPQFVMVPLDALEAITARLDALSRQIDGATITPRAEWVSINEAAKIRGVHPSTVHRWIERGEIEARGSGKARRVKLV